MKWRVENVQLSICNVIYENDVHPIEVTYNRNLIRYIRTKIVVVDVGLLFIIIFITIIKMYNSIIMLKVVC